MYGNFELRLQKSIATRLAIGASDPLNDNAGNTVVMFGMKLIMHEVMAAAITLLVAHGYPISDLEDKVHFKCGGNVISIIWAWAINGKIYRKKKGAREWGYGMRGMQFPPSEFCFSLLTKKKKVLLLAVLHSSTIYFALISYLIPQFSCR